MRPLALLTLLLALAPGLAQAAPAFTRPDGVRLSTARIEREATRLLAESRTPGLALALIQDGRVAFVGAYGLGRRAPDAPLKTTTVMYGASLTKALFATVVMELVDEGRLDLDRPLAGLLPKPLPAYDKYKDLADDPRWRAITPRMLLTHSAGFANFRFLEPDGRLRIHFTPGARYAYSGEGINLLQFALETGLGLDLEAEAQRRIFTPLAMTRTGLTWREAFADDAAAGFDDKGADLGHKKRGSPRAAGSMDTTIDDLARWAAWAIARHGLSSRAQEEMLRPQLAIAGAHQFPTLVEGPNPGRDAAQVQAALGWLAFDGPQGPGVYKGGHDDGTDNTLVCLRRARSCVLALTNSGVGARMFPDLVRAFLGETGAPWTWEYNPVLPLRP